jgi:Fur family peroxide stress response transcriptional regulator
MVDEFRQQLKHKGLKVTPQRLIVLEAMHELDHHPTTDHIYEFIRKSHPNIARGTVYKVLDVLSANQLIRKVKTESDIMRYDGVLQKHHHLYCAESDRIEDYADDELDEMLEEYFRKKDIKGFRIEDIILQIKGRFRHE